MIFEDQILNKLSKMSSLIDMTNTNLFGVQLAGICHISMLLSFGLFIIGILKKYAHAEGSIDLHYYLPLFFKFIMVLFFFGITSIYTSWMRVLLKLADILYSKVASNMLFDYQVQFRRFLYGIQNSADSMSSSIKNGNILSYLLSLVNSLVIAIYYIVISIGAYFLKIAVFIGPLLAAISLCMKGIGRVWLRFLISSLLFSFIVCIGLLAISQGGVFHLAGDYNFVQSHIMAFVMSLVVLLYLIIIPTVIATIFGINAYSKLVETVMYLINIFGIKFQGNTK